MTGSSAFVSANRKSSRPTSDAANQPTTNRSDQLPFWASVRAIRAETTATVNVTTPGMSSVKRAPSLRTFGSSRSIR